MGALDLASAALVTRSSTVAAAWVAEQQLTADQADPGPLQVPASYPTSSKEEIAAVITAEHGKVLSDALGRGHSGPRVAEFCFAAYRICSGWVLLNVSTGRCLFDSAESGSPPSSAVQLPGDGAAWFVPIAVACGNAVVLKPSEKDPRRGQRRRRLWKEAGLPDGVPQRRPRRQGAVDALSPIRHPRRLLRRLDADREICLMRRARPAASASRPPVAPRTVTLVLPDADLDLAPPTQPSTPVRPAGERCMAISPLLAVEPVADDLIEKIKDRMGKLVTGDGARSTDMASSPASTPTRSSPMSTRVTAGADLLVDGRDGDVDADGAGFFLRRRSSARSLPACRSMTTDHWPGPVRRPGPVL